MNIFPYKNVNKKNLIILILSLLVSIFTLVFTFAFPFEEDSLKELGAVGIAISSFLNSAVVYFFGFTIVTNFYVVKFYSLITVVLMIAIGGALGDLTSYGFGRGIQDFVHKSKKYLFVEKHFRKHPDLYTFVWASLPYNPIYDTLATVAGSSDYSVYRYFVLTFLGRIIRATIIALAGIYLLT